MSEDTTRRALLAAVLGLGAGGVAASPARDRLDQFAPLSGRAWEGTRRAVPGEVSSPHGAATVTYDDYHVPHVEADSEAAAYFAVGYVQAADRLFEMDLVRRVMAGKLAEVVGPDLVERDRFHRKMDFRGGAEASAAALSGTRTEALTEAYVEGVNAYVETGPAPLEMDVLGAEPPEWTVVDTLLVGQQISWGLTGSFAGLERQLLREELGAGTYRELYGRPFDHGAPIIRDSTGGEVEGVGSPESTMRDLDAEFADWLASFEPPPVWGSNHWAVSGEHTRSGSPILAYDPHLSLMAPPVWYEQRVSVGDVDVRGATFPGIPFVIVGENDHGAWGFTNTGADVMDLYTYETRDGQYRYEDGWRDFETETQTIAVAGAQDETVEVKKTVHGAYLERTVGGETTGVGVSWTGMTGTRESEAIYEFSHATGREDYRAALRKMDVPTQNALYVDDDGILYKVTGKIPLRRNEDGEVVRGDGVFDGSSGQHEWRGFEPFGQSTWEGFVPFEDKPGVVDPGYLGTANQRVVDDPTYPVGQEYASGFRGMRIYERLDRRVQRGDPIDREFMVSLQNDTLDIRARMLTPDILDARDRMPDATGEYLDAMAEWNYRMAPGSKAALAFQLCFEAFRDLTWERFFAGTPVTENMWPQAWVLLTLPPDHAAFDGDRAGLLADAMAEAVGTIEAEGYETYGDRHRTTIDHPFGGRLPALNYPRYPVGGSGATVFNTHDGLDAGSSWRQVSPMDGESLSVIPGGQDGSYFSEHYHDQLELWVAGEHKPMAFETPADGDTIQFGGDGG